MLNLEYILIGKLPETERDILLENLKTEREYGWNVLEWDSAKEHIQEGALAEKTILVSGDAKELSEAQRIGMAVLCYLMPGDGSDISGGYVCGRDGGDRRIFFTACL